MNNINHYRGYYIANALGNKHLTIFRDDKCTHRLSESNFTTVHLAEGEIDRHLSTAERESKDASSIIPIDTRMDAAAPKARCQNCSLGCQGATNRVAQS